MVIGMSRSTNSHIAFSTGFYCFWRMPRRNSTLNDWADYQQPFRSL